MGGLAVKAQRWDASSRQHPTMRRLAVEVADVSAPVISGMIWICRIGLRQLAVGAMYEQVRIGHGQILRKPVLFIVHQRSGGFTREVQTFDGEPFFKSEYVNTGHACSSFTFTAKDRYRPVNDIRG